MKSRIKNNITKRIVLFVIVLITSLVYNDAVTKLNRTIRMIPYSIVAPMCGVFARDYLKTEESKTEMPSMKQLL